MMTAERALPRGVHAVIRVTLALVLWAVILLTPSAGTALVARELLIVANRNVPESIPLAQYYMKRRGIPAENLLALSLSSREQCDRGDYEKNVLLPVRLYLKKRDPSGSRFRCIVTMYGVPLVVNGPSMSLRDRAKVFQLQETNRFLRLRMELTGHGEDEDRLSLRKKIDKNDQQIFAIHRKDATAALDSEIALALAKEYPLSGWVPNPAFVGYRGRKMKDMPTKALMVSRLDGPSEQIVRRIVDDSLAAEEKGLAGKAYFNARWPDPGDKDLSGYAFYDRSIHRAADHIRRSGLMDVVLKEKLFQPGECPQAALYCGWYSLGRYIDSFKWVTGAVGYHIASMECQTLRDKESKVWCKSMLEKGVVATLGPVGEPYVQAFPPPDLFFQILLDGRLTLAECFALSNPFLSWKMVLVGDPLYRPFIHKERKR